ncbi:hypothetical protein HDV06_004038 [Boothiomyces sp. JEL0866]|nr:hypothetical protein HDV06_004038 [Boothiomyces sp. JEL0866]
MTSNAPNGIQGRLYGQRNSKLALYGTFNNVTNLWNASGRQRRVSYQYFGRPLEKNDSTTMLTLLKSDLVVETDLNASIILQKPHRYFPRFDTAGILAGKPWSILDIQGKSKTFWIGSSVCFESVLDVMTYNTNLFFSIATYTSEDPQHNKLDNKTIPTIKNASNENILQDQTKSTLKSKNKTAQSKNGKSTESKNGKSTESKNGKSTESKNGKSTESKNGKSTELKNGKSTESKNTAPMESSISLKSADIPQNTDNNNLHSNAGNSKNNSNRRKKHRQKKNSTLSEDNNPQKTMIKKKKSSGEMAFKEQRYNNQKAKLEFEGNRNSFDQSSRAQNNTNLKVHSSTHKLVIQKKGSTQSIVYNVEVPNVQAVDSSAKKSKKKKKKKVDSAANINNGHLPTTLSDKSNLESTTDLQFENLVKSSAADKEIQHSTTISNDQMKSEPSVGVSSQPQPRWFLPSTQSSSDSFLNIPSTTVPINNSKNALHHIRGHGFHRPPVIPTPIDVPNNNHFEHPLFRKNTTIDSGHSTNSASRQFISSPKVSKSSYSSDPKEMILGMIKAISEEIDFENVKVPEMQVELRPYQIEGLAWMEKREKECNGGILADEMGLGKTVSMIALMSAQKEKTLVVVPLPVLEQWAKEIATKGPAKKVAKYHGSSRKVMFNNFDKYDIVLTTYNVIALDYIEELGSQDQWCPLFTTMWGRVILDEAHLICNRNTKTARACFILGAKYRWCLSGTLIQNKIEDLFSYFHFIDQKGHGDFNSFKRDYIKVFENDKELGLKKFHVLFKGIVLRRTKIGKNGENIITLPPITINTEELEFSPEEREIYDRIVQLYKGKIMNKYNMGLQVFGDTLVLLCRTKQACVDTAMVQHLADNAAEFESRYDDSETETVFSPENDWEDDLITRLNSVNIADRQPSTKFQRVLDLVRTYHEGKTKTIIFSQFTTALKSLKPILDRYGIKYAYLEGSMNTTKRNEQISMFGSDDACGVLLASLKCASTGMNLIMASNVILLDLWWNPAIQEQAYARVHRMGQTRPVNVHVLVIKDSVEQLILGILEKKKQLIQSAMGENTAAKMSTVIISNRLPQFPMKSQLRSNTLESQNGKQNIGPPASIENSSQSQTNGQQKKAIMPSNLKYNGIWSNEKGRELVEKRDTLFGLDKFRYDKAKKVADIPQQNDILDKCIDVLETKTSIIPFHPVINSEPKVPTKAPSNQLPQLHSKLESSAPKLNLQKPANPANEKLRYPVSTPTKKPVKKNNIEIHAVNSPYWKKKTNVYSRYPSNGDFRESYYSPKKDEESPSADPKDLILGLLKAMSDNLDYKSIQVPPMQVELRPYQIEGLAWLNQREIECKGGILADEMGLGKTISMIALMSTRRLKTLIVVPLPVLNQWANEIETKGAPGGHKIAMYQGSSRKVDYTNFEEYDVVLTTYNLIAVEYISEKPTSSQDSPLFTTSWGRVILDEAHLICNRNTKSARGCFALDAEFRWCLSGTLIQNKIDDLFSYFHFIDKRGHGEFKTFKNLYIDSFELNKVAGLKKFHILFKGFVLRRTKTDKNGKEVITLPPITIHNEILEFSKDERQIYESIVKMYKKKVLEKYRLRENVYGVALTLLCRTKQACVNTEMVKHLLEEDMESESAYSADDDWEDDLITKMTRANINENLKSSKFKKAIELVQLYRSQQTKTIIFSQFTTALYALQPILEELGIKFAFLVGSMNTKQRNSQISMFAKDEDCMVLLASLKCASTGMNLIMASNVILLDLWWNPAIQEQAYARVHRMGQTRPVNIHLLVVENSVEDLILRIQEKKKMLIQSTMGENTAESMTAKDILDIFNIKLPANVI